jgi:hypothetical protein
MSDSKTEKKSSTWITAQQIEWLKVNRWNGDWELVASQFNKKFKESRSTDAVRLAFSRYKEEDLSGRGFDWWQRQSFDSTREFKETKATYFVSGIMPLHTIDKDDYSYTYNHIDTDVLRTLVEQSKAGVQPVLLPMRAHTRPMEKSPSIYDPQLTPWKNWITEEAQFNVNLRAIDMRVNPQQQQPLTSMDKADPSSSILLASPRQNMEVIATGNNKHPRLLMGTGVINYAGYQANRIGKLAERAHRMGGMIIETDGKLFFPRRVRFDINGGYHDLDKYVHHSGVSSVRVEALIFGDIHFGQGNAELQKLAADLIKRLRPKALIFHDAFDGLSINHHMNMIDKIQRPAWAHSLASEAKEVRRLMNELKAAAPEDCKIYWVDSNHNDFLTRYLKDRRYFNDEVNFEKGHELQLALLSGHNPVDRLLGLNYINHLGPNDDLFIKGIQCANHGHIGVNGARGTRATVGKSASKLVTGHTHVPFEKDDHMGLGMWTEPRHGYNKGASTWLPSCGIIHADGSTQQVIPVRVNGSDKYKYTGGY